MTPLIEHAGIEGTRPRVIVDGKPVRLGPGERVDVTEDAAREHLDAGTVRLVDDADASVPTGDEHQGDEGEADGMEAVEPLPFAEVDAALKGRAGEVEPFEGDTSKLTKKQLVEELAKRELEHDKRWSEDRLRGVLDAALSR